LAEAPAAGKGGGGTSISKTIGRLNKFGGLLEPIKFTEVNEALEACGETNAGLLLTELENKAWEIKSPTKWILAAAKRVAGGEAPKVSAPRSSKGKGKGKGWGDDGWGGWGPALGSFFGQGGPYGDSWGGAWGGKGGGKGWGGGIDAKKISTTVGWLNKNKTDQMPEPIQWSQVQDVLCALGERQACLLLKEFQDKLDAEPGSIKQPTKWLKAAAARRVGW